MLKLAARTLEPSNLNLKPKANPKPRYRYSALFSALFSADAAGKFCDFLQSSSLAGSENCRLYSVRVGLRFGLELMMLIQRF